jgi:predicted Fe-Mo cluster-binding NifX family protein
MRIAIATEAGNVSMHFGRCPFFTIVDIKDGKAGEKQIVPNPGHQPGAIPKFLHDKGVNCIIAGGMGARASQFFAELGIEPIMGVSGSVEDVIKSFAGRKLKGGESLCNPGAGKGYGLDKTECDHPHKEGCDH